MNMYFDFSFKRKGRSDGTIQGWVCKKEAEKKKRWMVAGVE